MLRFSKGFVNNDKTKIVTDYVKITPNDRIDMIRKQRNGELQKQKDHIENPIKEYNNIHKDRVAAMKNIKKD